jgi:hypothetical protein
MSDRRMTIYINEQDRKDIEALKQLLQERGIDIRDERGNLSVSKMFRYLRNKELYTPDQKYDLAVKPNSA